MTRKMSFFMADDYTFIILRIHVLTSNLRCIGFQSCFANKHVCCIQFLWLKITKIILTTIICFNIITRSVSKYVLHLTIYFSNVDMQRTIIII